MYFWYRLHVLKQCEYVAIILVHNISSLLPLFTLPLLQLYLCSVLFFKFLGASKNVAFILFKCSLNNVLVSFFSSTFWNSSRNTASWFISGSSHKFCSDAIPCDPFFSGTTTDGWSEGDSSSSFVSHSLSSSVARSAYFSSSLSQASINFCHSKFFLRMPFGGMICLMANCNFFWLVWIQCLSAIF